MKNRDYSYLVFYTFIVIGESYYINTKTTVIERKCLQKVRPYETINIIIGRNVYKE